MARQNLKSKINCIDCQIVHLYCPVISDMEHSSGRSWWKYRPTGFWKPSRI